MSGSSHESASPRFRRRTPSCIYFPGPSPGGNSAARCSFGGAFKTLLFPRAGCHSHLSLLWRLGLSRGAAARSLLPRAPHSTRSRVLDHNSHQGVHVQPRCLFHPERILDHGTAASRKGIKRCGGPKNVLRSPPSAHLAPLLFCDCSCWFSFLVRPESDGWVELCSFLSVLCGQLDHGHSRFPAGHHPRPFVERVIRGTILLTLASCPAQIFFENHPQNRGRAIVGGLFDSANSAPQTRGRRPHLVQQLCPARLHCLRDSSGSDPPRARHLPPGASRQDVIAGSGSLRMDACWTLLRLARSRTCAGRRHDRVSADVARRRRDLSLRLGSRSGWVSLPQEFPPRSLGQDFLWSLRVSPSGPSLLRLSFCRLSPCLWLDPLLAPLACDHTPPCCRLLSMAGEPLSALEAKQVYVRSFRCPFSLSLLDPRHATFPG